MELNFTSNSFSYFWAYNATLSQICDLIKSKGPASSSSFWYKNNHGNSKYIIGFRSYLNILIKELILLLPFEKQDFFLKLSIEQRWLLKCLWSKFNRPFPSSAQPPFQSEAKCEVFVMKISFHSYWNCN